MANKKEREIIGYIRYIATDKRGRVLLTDHNEWLEEKLSEIRQLVKLLLYEKCSGKKKW